MSKKNILILCTGNSCRSIMAEALINAKLPNCVSAQSSGVKATGEVNSHVKSLLKKKAYWRDKYHSKVIEDVLNEPFDLIITVCDNAKESCPMFPKNVKTIHIGFEDPNGKEIKEYSKTLDLIEKELLPLIQKEFCL